MTDEAVLVQRRALDALANALDRHAEALDRQTAWDREKESARIAREEKDRVDGAALAERNIALIVEQNELLVANQERQATYAATRDAFEAEQREHMAVCARRYEQMLGTGQMPESPVKH